jgi:hypothetical protein
MNTLMLSYLHLFYVLESNELTWWYSYSFDRHLNLTWI